MNREKFEKLMGLVFEVNTKTGNEIVFHCIDGEALKLILWDYEEGTREIVSLGLDYTMIDEDYEHLINTCEIMLEESEVPV